MRAVPNMYRHKATLLVECSLPVMTTSLLVFPRVRLEQTSVPIVNQNCLALRLVRLKPTDEWLNERADLSFVFPQAGVGKYVSTAVTRQVAGGDVLVLNGVCGGKLCVASGDELAFWNFSVSLEHLFPL